MISIIKLCSYHIAVGCVPYRLKVDVFGSMFFFSNNMLYPAQHMTAEGGRLKFECKVFECKYFEFANDTCIYINRMTQDIEYVTLPCFRYFMSSRTYRALYKFGKYMEISKHKSSVMLKMKYRRQRYAFIISSITIDAALLPAACRFNWGVSF